MGRPTKYTESMCGDVVGLMAEGMSRKATAKALGIDYKTFIAYMDTHEAFREAVAEGDVTGRSPLDRTV